MSDHLHTTVEDTGSSAESVDDAIREAVGKATQSVRNLEWFEAVGVRGHIVGGDVGDFHNLKIGFRLE